MASKSRTRVRVSPDRALAGLDEAMGRQREETGMTRDEFVAVLRRLLPGRPLRAESILAVAGDGGDYQAVAEAVQSGLLIAEWIARVAERQRTAAAGTGGRA